MKITEKLKRVGEKIGLGAIILGTLYVANQGYLNLLSEYNLGAGKKPNTIFSQAELEKKISERRNKAGVPQNFVVEGRYFDGNEGALSQKDNEDHYLIWMSSGRANYSILDHELYHIAAGHCELIYAIESDCKVNKTGFLNPECYSLENKLKRMIRDRIYLYWDEPTAIMYEAIGLKL